MAQKTNEYKLLHPAASSFAERRQTWSSFVRLKILQRAYKYLVARLVLNIPEGDSRIHSCTHSRTPSATPSVTSYSDQLDTEQLRAMLATNTTGNAKIYGNKSSANGKWACKCLLALFTVLFITFWCIIIFYASRRDRPLDIEVSNDFILPDIKPKFDQHNPRVPLLFHQMWKSPNIPAKWKAAHDGCVDRNSEYQLILWTDEMIYNFISRYYPWFYSIFVNYPYHIQRVDVSRYFILYHYGGVYLDVDAACKTPFRDIVKNMTSQESVLLPMTDIYGVTNSFMVSEPNSDFFKYVIYELPNFAHGGYNLVRHTTIIFSTGPMFMSHCVTTFRGRSNIHVMTLSDYDEKHFYHAKGGSWHGMDTEIVDAFHFHYVELVIVLCIVLCTLLICRFGKRDIAATYFSRVLGLCPFLRKIDRKDCPSGHVKISRDSNNHSRTSSRDSSSSELSFKNKVLMV